MCRQESDIMTEFSSHSHQHEHELDAHSAHHRLGGFQSQVDDDMRLQQLGVREEEIGETGEGMEGLEGDDQGVCLPWCMRTYVRVRACMSMRLKKQRRGEGRVDQG